MGNLVLRLSKPTIAFFLGILVATVTSNLFAYNGNASLIHGCVKTSNGTLQIVGANESCGTGKTPLHWIREAHPFTYTNCPVEFLSKFAGGDLSNSFITGSGMNDINLANTNFAGSFIQLSSMFNTDFSNSNFSNAFFDNDNLEGANFSGANTSGATWKTTICPDGTKSDDNGNTYEGHLTP